MPTLPVKKGLTAAAVFGIPEKWDKQWFRYFIDAFLTNADIRNVVTDSGITISGNVSGNNTVGSGSPVTIGQTPVATNTVMGNVSGISAAPVALSQVQLTSLINVFTSSLAGDAPASGGGTSNFLRADGTWNIPAGSAAIPNNTVLGNISGGVATPVALTQAQLTALVNVFTASLPGSVPASTGGTTTFLRADSTFAVPPTFTAIAPGYVPASAGGTTTFLRADGTFAVPVTVTGANPTASVGLAAVNGTATTFLRSDGAPALSQAIVPTWSGVHTFSARPAFNLGATIAGGTFISRGISDSSLVTAITIASTQAVSLSAPTSGSSLTINGNGAAVAEIIVSGITGTTAASDVSIRRAGSTANLIGRGPSLDITDTTANTATAWQHSGGQSELWQFNGGWNQILKVTTSLGVVINAPSAGIALVASGTANGFAGQFVGSSTSGQSRGLQINAGTTSADFAVQINNQANTITYFLMSGNGQFTAGWNGTANVLSTSAAGGVSISVPSSGDTLTLAPSATSGALIATSAALTNNAGATSPTLGTTGPAGATTPTKWIKINDNGTIRSIPAW